MAAILAAAICAAGLLYMMGSDVDFDLSSGKFVAMNVLAGAFGLSFGFAFVYVKSKPQFSYAVMTAALALLYFFSPAVGYRFHWIAHRPSYLVLLPASVMLLATAVATAIGICLKRRIPETLEDHDMKSASVKWILLGAQVLLCALPFFSAFSLSNTVMRSLSESEGSMQLWEPAFYSFFPMPFFFVGVVLVYLLLEVRKLRSEMEVMRNKCNGGQDAD
jgi:hypothetical protein